VPNTSNDRIAKDLCTHIAATRNLQKSRIGTLSHRFWDSWASYPALENLSLPSSRYSATPHTLETPPLSSGHPRSIFSQQRQLSAFSTYAKRLHSSPIILRSVCQRFDEDGQSADPKSQPRCTNANSTLLVRLSDAWFGREIPNDL
jgi:hypothetical protein